jgi:hypothetical protein
MKCNMKSRSIRFASGSARQTWISDCKSRENRESGKANRNALVFMGGLTALVLIGIVLEKKWGVFSPQN